MGVLGRAASFVRAYREAATGNTTNVASKDENANPSKIADLPSYRKIDSYQAISKLYGGAVRLVAPVARLLGRDVSEHVQRAAELSMLTSEAAIHRTLADRFNQLYVKRGWVAYGSMSSQLLLSTVAMGEAGDPDGGEAALAASYDEGHISFMLMRMTSLENFRDRLELAHLAKADYLAGRFHASVPLVLMMIDGLATDASGNNESFFSKDATLTAWDSMEGHFSALPALKDAMCTPRLKRRTDSINLPHRHGILHGRDLGYSNQLVAAKCWGTLFAVSEWVRKVEHGEREEPCSAPKRSLSDQWKAFRDDLLHQERWKNWKSPNITVGVDLPAFGPVAEYLEGSPQRAAMEFLHAWKSRNYGALGRLCSFDREMVSDSKRAGRVREVLEGVRVKGFRLRSAALRAPSMFATEVELELEKTTLTVELQIVREKVDGEWLYADLGEGTWRAMNWRLLAFLCERASEPSP